MGWRKPGRHEDADGSGIADWAEQHPYRAATDATVIAHEVSSHAVSGGLTADTLRTAMGANLSLARYQALLPGFTAAMQQAGCTTVNRAAMWCAQLGHESVGLRYMAEIWGPSAQQLKYDPASGSDLARQLGNTVRGDGYTYRGSGPIQITGRGNFANISAWAHGRGIVPTATYFVDNPDALRSDTYGFVGAVWYWTVARPDINALSDAGDLTTVTRRINGGTTGLADRLSRWNACLKLGAALLPGTTSSVPVVDTGRRHRQQSLLL